MDEPTRRAPRRPILPAALFLVLLLAGAREARADIYSWTDEQGVQHFTDDEGAIPGAQRGKAKLYIKEGPKRAPEPRPAEAPPPSAGRAPGGPPPDGPAGGGEPGRLEAEQLKAKIEAKESLLRSVDQKRSLAIDPLRNRIVDESDMELYRKYQDELPADRERLREMEERLR